MMTLPGKISYYSGDLGEGFIPRTAKGSLPSGRTYVCKGGERIDQIAHVAYGFQLGAVEALLLWNHGLGDQPVELPEFLAVELPELTANSSTVVSREVALWG